MQVAAVLWAEHSNRKFSHDFTHLKDELTAAVVEQIIEGRLQEKAARHSTSTSNDGDGDGDEADGGGGGGKTTSPGGLLGTYSAQSRCHSETYLNFTVIRLWIHL